MDVVVEVADREWEVNHGSRLRLGLGFWKKLGEEEKERVGSLGFRLRSN